MKLGKSEGGEGAPEEPIQWWLVSILKISFRDAAFLEKAQSREGIDAKIRIWAKPSI